MKPGGARAIVREPSRTRGSMRPTSTAARRSASRSSRSYERASSLRGLSARGVQSLRRVARTLADLEGNDAVAERHLLEALALRAPVS
jgi:predicted ATPase with chaperone activity